MTASTRHAIKLIYLLALSVLLFVYDRLEVVVALLVLQSSLWIASRLPLRLLLPMASRLGIFFFFIAIAYVFFPMGAAAGSGPADWYALPLGPWTIEINQAGFGIALIMCLRVWVLVMASLWVQRSSGQDEMVSAMVALRVPHFLAVALETTLELLAGDNKKSVGTSGAGHGRGGGGGRGTGHGNSRRERIVIRFHQIRHGDFSFLYELIERSLQRAEKHVSKAGGLNHEQTRDVAIIAGISVVIMGLKMFQIMPGLPVAPGHKNLIIIPLFLMASSLTHARFGGLWTGLCVGVINFMLGFGKFGLLEVFQFIVPGLLADLLLPLLRGGKWLRLVQLVMFGALMGLARFVANILVIMLAGAPTAAFVIYLPMLLSQMLFGMLSVLVAGPLLIWSAANRDKDSGMRAGREAGTQNSSDKHGKQSGQSGNPAGRKHE